MDDQIFDKEYDKVKHVDLKKTMEPSRYVGRSKEQVDAFLSQVVKPILEEYKDLLGVKAEITV